MSTCRRAGHHQPLRLAQTSSATEIVAIHQQGDGQGNGLGGVVDDDVHAQHRGDRADRQGHRGDHREAFRGDGHLGVGAGLVELDGALQIVLLPVGHGPESVELVDSVLDPGLTLLGAEDPDLGHPGVHLPGQRCHGLHGQQAVPGPEHLVQELLGVTLDAPR